MDISSLHQHLREIIDKVAAKYNFLRTDNGREKKYDWGYDSIDNSQVYYISYEANLFKMAVILSRRIDILETCWEGYHKEINIFYNHISYLNSFSISSVWIEEFKDGGPAFSISEEGFKQFEEYADYMIREKLLQKGEELRDLRRLDQLINNDINSDNPNNTILNRDGYIYRRMALAKLTGNPIYEALCEDERKYFSDYIEASQKKGQEFYANYPIVFEKVYESLKNVMPLEDTYLH